MEKPFISFVVTARNDDYGGNWVNRINAFIKTLSYQTKRTQLPCELIFVEYNPPEGKKPMSDELTLPTHKYFSIRFITVPKEFHNKLPRSNEVTVCEFIGKNIGIKRATGEYVIATNPDTIYSDKLFDFFADKNIKKTEFYRLNRVDTSINYIDPKLTIELILKKVQKHTIKVLFNNHTVYTSYKAWAHDFIHGRTWKILTLCPLFNGLKNIITDNSIIHENAAGDFLLMHKNMWEDVRGYDQATVGSGVLDGYIMYILYCKGYQQNIIPYPIFHLYHHHKGVRYLASYTKLRRDAELMLETKIPYKEYSKNWGFPDENFLEKTIN